MKEHKYKNNSEIHYQVYISERNALVEGEKSQSNSFDKYLLTFAAGTFGITITFMDLILSEILPNTKWMVSTAWGLLATSILFILISFLTSQIAYRKQIDILEEIYIHHNEEAEQTTNAWSVLTFIINSLSIFLFIGGIVFLFIFVVKNL